MPETKRHIPERKRKMPELFGKMPERKRHLPETKRKFPEPFGKIYFFEKQPFATVRSEKNGYKVICTKFV